MPRDRTVVFPRTVRRAIPPAPRGTVIPNRASRYDGIGPGDTAVFGKLGPVMLVASLAINAGLAWKMHSLRARLSSAAGASGLKTGELVLPAKVTDLHGNPAEVNYEAAAVPTVLYVFTPTCGWCLRNIANVKSLFAQSSSKYRVIGISLAREGLADYVASHSFSFPVYVAEPRTAVAYGLGSTPQTIVISTGGRVLQNWRGAYDGPTKKDVEIFFAAKLPGLEPPAPR